MLGGFERSRKMTLDFPGTCYDIDKIHKELEEYIKDKTEDMLDKVKNSIEELKEINIKMRKQADEQISELKDEIELQRREDET
jgi:hypothetical protein